MRRYQCHLGTGVKRKASAMANPIGKLVIESYAVSTLDAHVGILLQKEFPGTHLQFWDYYVKMNERQNEVAKRKMETTVADGSAAREDEADVRFLSDFSRELQLSTDVGAVVQQLKEAGLLARDESSGLQQLAADEVRALLDAAAKYLSEMEEMVRHRLDDADDLVATSKKWTLEVSGKAGGIEAGYFASDLLELYRTYCSETRGWKVELLDPADATTDAQHGSSDGTGGGALRIEGQHVLRFLKYEMGIHRVQRVPVTDKDGKMQTSTAAVTLMPIPSALSVDVKDADCDFEFVRGSGPGGQGVQTSCNCCIARHRASGIRVRVHQTRSALTNKEIAMEMIAQRLWKKKMSTSQRAQDALFANQWKSGERSEKLRSYNYVQNRVTDQRSGQSYPLEMFMQGARLMEQLHWELGRIDFVNDSSKWIRDTMASNFCL